MFIIFILYHILYIIFQIKKQKNQFISLPIEEGDFLIRLLNWVGFYLFENEYLVVGPFQGKPACVEIQVGNGVCGKAFQLNQVLNVKNVHLFEGHIACDSDSNSELVIPLVKNDIKIGVLDIDSPLYNRFDSDLQNFFESFAHLLLTYYKDS